MSRFLEYGVFVPNKNLAEQEAAARAAANTFKWAKVGGKWQKVGEDGKPFSVRQDVEQTDDPCPGTLRDHLGQSSCVGEGEGEGPLGADADKVGFGSRDDDLSAEDDIDSHLLEEEAGLEGEELEGEEDEGGIGKEDSEAQSGEDFDPPSASSSTPTSAWATPPPTSDSCSPATPSPPSPESAERRRNDHSGPPEPIHVANKEGGEGGGGTLGDHLRGTDRGHDEGETQVGAWTGMGSSGMLTPGMSRRYSKQELMTKMFGGKEPQSTHPETAAGNENGLRSTQRPVSGLFRSFSRSGSVINATTVVDENANCQGERAVRKTEEDRGGGEGDGTGRVSATSPVGPPKTPVETRDQECQWNGSEISDEEKTEELRQVELPDTPDGRALMAVLRLYDHAKSENRRLGIATSKPGWGVDPDLEGWEGVYLDDNDRVVALDVDGVGENRQQQLIGAMPVELGEMDRLEQLTMRKHRFKGRIPSELGKLSLLTHLNLSNNRLTGFIPPELGELKNLVVLNLSWNFMSGEIPGELGRLTNLEELLLNSNAFSGALPMEMGRMRKLQRFSAGHNIHISGTLPLEFGRMQDLIYLDLRHNKITGPIPAVWCRMRSLQQLWLQDNQLTDDIPPELARLGRLQMMCLANNKLSGVIPKAVRGHPKYQAFVILKGNVALGERVAPNNEEIEAAMNKKPTATPKSHGAAISATIRAQSMATFAGPGGLPRGAQGPPGHSVGKGEGEGISPSRPVSTSWIVGQQRKISFVAGSGHRKINGEEDFKRRSESYTMASSTLSGGGGRGRKGRAKARIMGKRQSPPTSPVIHQRLAGEDGYPGGGGERGNTPGRTPQCWAGAHQMGPSGATPQPKRLAHGP